MMLITTISAKWWILHSTTSNSKKKNTQILGFSYFLNILNWFQIQRHSRQIWIFILYKNNIYIQIDIEKTNVMCCDTMLRMLEFMLA